MKYASVLVLVTALISLVNICSPVSAQNKFIVVADFNKQVNSGNIGGEFGTWDKDPNDATQGCRMTFVKDDALGSKDGMSVRLDYDVDSPNPAYNGFWLKLDSVEAANYDTLSFYIKGDAVVGFTNKIKVEIKDQKRGKATHVVEGISETWKKISIPLKFDRSIKKPFSEFTIIFDDIASRPKRGAILLDEIEFTGGAVK